MGVCRAWPPEPLQVTLPHNPSNPLWLLLGLASFWGALAWPVVSVIVSGIGCQHRLDPGQSLRLLPETPGGKADLLLRMPNRLGMSLHLPLGNAA